MNSLDCPARRPHLRQNQRTGRALCERHLVVTTNLGSFTPSTDLPLHLRFHPQNPSYSGGYGPPGSSFRFFGEMMTACIGALNPAEIRSPRGAARQCSIWRPPWARIPRSWPPKAHHNLHRGRSGSALAYQWFAAGQPIPSATTSGSRWRRCCATALIVLVTNAWHRRNRVATLCLPANQCLQHLHAVASGAGKQHRRWQ
jgi:hypothetical protein